jgi:ribosomal-protein-alanine N-acetyltransferase
MPKPIAEHPEPYAVDTMTEGDLEHVLTIERTAFAAPWSRESFRYELANPRAGNLVVRRGPEVLGYVCVWAIAGELKINNIAVRADVRGQGLGAALLEAAIALGRARGCVEATLEVRPSNLSAASLYRRLGFQVVGRRKAYYQDTGEDAILMYKDLGA